MKPTCPVYIGAPLTGDEARFLRTLAQRYAGSESLILANFELAGQQIDFVLITLIGATLIELKNFSRAVFGDLNGSWHLLNASATQDKIGNPYKQALAQKFALSDAMRSFQGRASDVPSAAGKGFFADFAAYVCVSPAVASGSRVTKGDAKVRVRGCADMFSEIDAGGSSPSWQSEHWARFAVEHLKLDRTTVEAATDPKVRQAEAVITAYRARVRGLLGADLPPLLPANEDGALRGPRLIAYLLQPRNYLLSGPTGTAKTFHLQHLALALEAGDVELPVFLEAKKYRGGDFWQVLRQSSAPFSFEDPKVLLEAGTRQGLRPVLLLDALNECGEAHRADLLKGAQAFVLRYGSRIVATSQQTLTLPADLAAETLNAALPEAVDKRAIYAYHAGVTPTQALDAYSDAFLNTYDLTIAGRCHGTGTPPASRTDLYDRYIRTCVPQHAAVVTALMRNVACRMAADYALVLRRDAFARIAESMLEAAHAPIGILDELLNIRFARLSDQYFAFEHELLFDYFRAEGLHRRASGAPELVSELRRPRNNCLIEFVLPRLEDRGTIAEVLAIVTDPALLLRVLAGECGAPAQEVLNAACLRLLDEAIADLPNLRLRCHTVEREADGARVIVDIMIEGHRVWLSHDSILCEVIGRSLTGSTFAARFVELLDATEWTLRRGIDEAADMAGVGRRYAWSEVVRLHGGTMWRGTMSAPCGDIMRVFQQAYRDALAPELREQLTARALGEPRSDFALATLLADHTAASARERVGQNAALVRRSWESGIYIQRLHGLEFAKGMRSATENAGPEAVAAMRGMLEGFDTKNVFVNTVLLETQSAYGGLEIEIDAEGSAREMRALIRPEVAASDELRQMAHSLQVEPTTFLASLARGCLDKMWEDVFQGVYWDAYADLTSAERFDLLSLALLDGDRDGMFLDWMLRELIEIGDQRAAATCRRFAADIQTPSAFPQGATATYVLGIEGCARWQDAPIERPAAADAAHAAWHAIGDILFWVHKDTTKHRDAIDSLWRRLNGQVLLAAGDVLHQLASSRWRSLREHQEHIDLIVLFPDEVKRVAEACLNHEEALPSAFRSNIVIDEQLIRFLIGALGRCGDHGSLGILKVYAEVEKFGRGAVEAIQSIQQRLLQGA